MGFWNRSPAADEAPLACSFCGKKQTEVAQLIAGPTVYICDDCVRISMDIVVEKTTPAPPPPPPPTAAGVAAAMDAAVGGHPELVALLARVVAAHAAGSGRSPRILLVGPGGAGKTALCQALVAACGLPATHAHAHRITATGYIGADVENIVQELVLAAGDRPGGAERGLLVLEDLHHLALAGPHASLTRDVGGRDVQPHLVRLLDGRDLYLPEDPTRRIHSMVPGARFSPAGLLCVWTARMAAPPTEAGALRAALVDQGLMPELLDRIDLVLPVALPPAPARAAIIRDHIAPAVAAATGHTPVLDAAALDRLVAATDGPSGLWAARQALVATALGR